MEFTPPFGPWLKLQRARLDLTQGDLARRVGYSPETIRKIEAGALKPSKQIVDLLADHLGVLPAQRDDFLAFATGRDGKAEPVPTNLPTPATKLIGREKDVTAVTKLLKRGETRLVTLVGPPGVGKTRLVIEVAREASEAFADGAWFVPLAAVMEPETVLSSIAQTLEIEQLPGLTSMQVLRRHLAARELLLVLDNLEQVLDAAPLIAEVLSTAPKVKALATSREPLQIAGEQRYTVQPLVSEPAVALFVERARAIQPDFAPTPEVSVICDKLDGLPLAIELAAARITLFTPMELLARLDQRLMLLTGGGRDLPSRQRTLRATLDWSYDLLSPDEQALFRRLGVFAGGFTLQAAQTFCAVDHLPLAAVDGMGALVAKSLLVRRELMDGDGESRYFMLETMREYALEKLAETGESDIWHRKLAELVAGMVNRRDQGFALEIDNWRAAIAWVASSEHSSKLALALFACGVHGESLPISWTERADTLEKVLALPPAPNNWSAHALALNDLGKHVAQLGDLRRAQHISQAALAMCREHKLQSEMADALYLLGHHARERGDVEQSRGYFQASLQKHHDSNSTDPTIGMVLMTMAEVEVVAEDAAQALSLLDESLPLIPKSGRRASDLLSWLLGWESNHRAHAFQLQGNFSKAKALLRQSSDYFANVPTERPDEDWYRWGFALNYQSLGEIALSEQNVAESRSHSQESLRLHDEFGDKMGIAWCLATLAGAAALDEEPERGARLWGASEALREQVGCRIAPASRLNRERTVAMLREQLGEAEFARLAAEGAKMSVDEAIALALAVADTQQH